MLWIMAAISISWNIKYSVSLFWKSRVCYIHDKWSREFYTLVRMDFMRPRFPAGHDAGKSSVTHVRVDRKWNCSEPFTHRDSQQGTQTQVAQVLRLNPVLYWQVHAHGWERFLTRFVLISLMHGRNPAKQIGAARDEDWRDTMTSLLQHCDGYI